MTNLECPNRGTCNGADGCFNDVLVKIAKDAHSAMEVRLLAVCILTHGVTGLDYDSLNHVLNRCEGGMTHLEELDCHYIYARAKIYGIN